MDKRELFRQLPKVDNLLEEELIKQILEKEPRLLVVEGLRGYLDELRQGIKDGSVSELPINEELVRRALHSIKNAVSIGDEPVVNASGILLNEKIGRSPIAAPETASLLQSCSLLVQRLTGAEQVLFSNNGSSALLLALTALCKGKEVVVPSSHLVRIGDFDLVETIEAAGAEMVEVGCTNRVHLKDFAKAISEKTGAILYVHRPNVETVGFIKDTETWKLAELARRKDIPLIVDEGIGSLVDLREFGHKRNPLLRDFVDKEANIVTFSTDKLVGGPQGGVLITSKECGNSLASHPLFRSIRMDNGRLSILAKALKLFLEPTSLAERHPLYRQLSRTPQAIAQRAECFCNLVNSQFSEKLEVKVFDGLSSSHNSVNRYLALDTTFVSIETKESVNFARFVQRLGKYIEPASVDDNITIDFRTVCEEDEELLIRAIEASMQYNSPKRGDE